MALVKRLVSITVCKIYILDNYLQHVWSFPENKVVRVGHNRFFFSNWNCWISNQLFSFSSLEISLFFHRKFSFSSPGIFPFFTWNFPFFHLEFSLFHLEILVFFSNVIASIFHFITLELPLTGGYRCFFFGKAKFSEI